MAAEATGAADVEAFLEELKGVALEANRLRRGVLSDLVAAAGGVSGGAVPRGALALRVVHARPRGAPPLRPVPRIAW